MRAQIIVLFVSVAVVCGLAEKPFGVVDIFQQLHREPPLPEGFSAITPVAVEEKWITQPLDHFDPSNKQTWEMRYYERTDYYKKGGPIFIFIGGEWSIHPAWLQTGNFHDIAREVGAYLVYTEHRYYGESRPVPDTTTDNLKYLTVDQALADLRRFIEQAKLRFGLRSKVVVAGGSYAGTMAAWLRYAYPLHVTGAWSSCAPVEAKVDFYGYKELVGEAFAKEGGQECYDSLQTAFEMMQDMIARNDTKRIQDEFQMCYNMDVTKELDVINFYYGIQNLLSGQIQGAKEGSIKATCDYLTHPFWADPLAGLAAFVRLAYGDYCYSHLFEPDIAYGQVIDWSHSANSGGYRPWLYQTCNEFGWYQTTGSDNQPYGRTVPAGFSIEICKRLYGSQFNSIRVELNTQLTNLKYRGLKNTVTNVYYTHGEFDPWNRAGIVKGLHEKSPADVIPKASHTTELLSVSSADSEDMKRVKLRVRELILQWLNL